MLHGFPEIVRISIVQPHSDGEVKCVAMMASSVDTLRAVSNSCSVSGRQPIPLSSIASKSNTGKFTD
jgi:hypothetical protein